MASVIANLPAPGYKVKYADLIGKPFKLGGRGPDYYDCYGLMMELGRRSGVTLPDHASPEVLSGVAGQIDTCVQLWTPCNPGPGAIVTLRVGRTVGHVGMVLSGGIFIHCWEKSNGVCTEGLHAWKNHIDGFYCFTGNQA